MQPANGDQLDNSFGEVARTGTTNNRLERDKTD